MASTELPGALLEKMYAAEQAVDAEFEGKLSTPAAEPPSEPEAVPAVKTDEAAPKEPNSEVSSPTSEAPKFGKDYQDLLNKFDGDHDKAAKAFWETNNRAAQLAKELEELKAGKTPESAAPPAKEPEAVVHPDVKRYDDTLRSIEASYAKVKADYEEFDKQAADVEKQIRQIERKRLSPEIDFEADQALVKELREKYAEQEGLQRALSALQGKADQLNDRYITQTNLKAHAETLAQITQAREAEITERTRRQEDAALDTFTTTYFEHMTKVAKEGDQIPEELLEDWKAFSKKEAHIKLNVEDLPVTDVPAFVLKAKEDFLASIDRAHRSKSKVYAKNKAQDAEVNAPDGAAAVATTPKKGGFRSQEDFDRHIESLSANL